MDDLKMCNINIAFDNAGGAVLASKTYAHVYNSGKQLATDVRVLLDGGSTSDWDGNEEDVLKAFPAEADRYERVYRLLEIKDLVDNSCVELVDDERNALIHWEGGNRPQNGTGFMEYEFWAALLAEETEA